MMLEISYHKKCDYDYIILNDVKCIYPLDDRYKENKKEYIVITKKEYKELKSIEKLKADYEKLFKKVDSDLNIMKEILNKE